MSSRLLRLFVAPPAVGEGARDEHAADAGGRASSREPAAPETAEFDVLGDSRPWEAPALARHASASAALLPEFAALRARAATGGQPADRTAQRAVVTRGDEVGGRSGARGRALLRCAVLGSRGAAEVAAGLAMVARRRSGAAAALVVVVSAVGRSSGAESASAAPAAAWPPGAETKTSGEPRQLGVETATAGEARPLDAAASRGSGASTRAARRLAATLEGLGVDAIPRGRLVWASVTVTDARDVAALERIAALAVPQVLLVAAARTEALDAALASCDVLVHVTSTPESPLAALLATDAERPGAPPVLNVAPLGWLGRAAVRTGRVAPRRLARLVADGAEERPT